LGIGPYLTVRQVLQYLLAYISEGERHAQIL
jgi:hypothetical protein